MGDRSRFEVLVLRLADQQHTVLQVEVSPAASASVAV